MAEYKPYEAPQYMQDYAQTATDPFGRSLLGQKLAMEKLEEMTDTNYEEPINASMPDSGLPNIGLPEEINEAGVGGVAMGALNKGLTGGLLGSISTKGGKMLGKKAGAKLLTKLGTRMIPGLGWGLAAADLVDYFGMPIYDYLPGGMGDYMTFRDTTEGEQ